MIAARFVGVVLSTCALVGCGAGVVRDVRERPAVAASSEPAGRARVVVVPRPTHGRVWASLWIDAGFRDAESPATAALAAWVASDGTEASASVVPDGTELALPCEVEALERCLATLTGALRARRVDDAAWGRATARLAAARGASDGRARAERLALEALLGERLDPTDGDAVAPADVERFLAEHYGPERALVVLVGDADAEAVSELVAGAVSDAPSASAPRRARSISAREGARVEVGERDVVAVALDVEADRAADSVRRVDAWLSPRDRSSRVAAFPLRGGWVMLATSSNVDAGELGARLLMARAEASRGAGSSADDAMSIAHAAGARWVGEGGSSSAGAGLGIGALVSSEHEREIDALSAELLARARSAGAPPALDERGDASLDNGARVHVRALSSEQTTAVLALSGGASEDGPREHGRAALVAAWMGQRCQGIEAWADADRVLVARTIASREDVLDGLGELLDCTLHGEPTLAELEGARAVAIASLDRAARYRARVAEALAPLAPGAIAPMGSAHGIAAVDAGDVRQALGAWRVGARAAVAIAGDVDAEAAAGVAARRLALLPRGEPAQVSEGGAPLDELLVREPELEAAELIVGWRASRSEEAACARRVARALAARASAGASAAWWDGGSSSLASWAAVAFRGPAAELDALRHIAVDEEAIARECSEARADASERAAWDASSSRATALSAVSVTAAASSAGTERWGVARTVVVLVPVAAPIRRR